MEQNPDLATLILVQRDSQYDGNLATWAYSFSCHNYQEFIYKKFPISLYDFAVPLLYRTIRVTRHFSIFFQSLLWGKIGQLQVEEDQGVDLREGAMGPNYFFYFQSIFVTNDTNPCNGHLIGFPDLQSAFSLLFPNFLDLSPRPFLHSTSVQTIATGWCAGWHFILGLYYVHPNFDPVPSSPRAGHTCVYL